MMADSEKALVGNRMRQEAFADAAERGKFLICLLYT
jgi:hypothetical protein